MIAKDPAPHQVDTEQVDEEHPWPGLAAFREEDHFFFHGRDREAGDLCRLVLRNRLTLLYGLSGLGKTSLLRAGLFRRLRDAGVFPVYLRLHYTDESSDPSLQVKETILKVAADARIESPPPRPEETLWEYFHRRNAEFWGPRHRLLIPLLVFDQFEEIFTLGKARQSRRGRAESFLYEIIDLAQGSIPDTVRARLEAAPEAARELSFTRHNYKILLSLREDYLPDLQDQGEAVSSLLRNCLRLHRMNGDQAFEVVKAGRDLISDEVAGQVTRVVAKANEAAPLGDLEVDPALLSVFCRELNNKRIEQDQPSITAPLLEGHRAVILADFYERSLTDIPQSVRDFIENRLVNSAGQREILTLDTVLETVSRETIEELVDRRLLRIEERAGIPRVELIHDLLTDVIRQSRASRRERGALEQEEAARREAEKREQEVRWELWRTRILVAVFVVLSVVAGTAAWLNVAARRQARRALAGSDIERASNLRDSNPAHALAYLARAIRLEPESIRAQSLLTDLLLGRTWPRPIAELRVGDADLVDLSGDGRLFAAVTKSGRVRLWDTRTLQRVGEVRQTDPVESLDISQDGRRILIVSPGTAQLWDTRTGRPLLGQLALDEKSRALLSPDGRWLARSDGQILSLREDDTDREREIRLPESFLGFDRFRFSPDGRRILASDRTQVLLWDIESGRQNIRREGLVHSLSFSSDSRYLLTAGRETTLWDIGEETPDERRIGGNVGPVWISPGGERIAIYDGSEIQIWKTHEPGQLIAVLSSAIPHLLRAEFSQDGQLLLTTSETGVKLWDADTGRLVNEAFCDCQQSHFLEATGLIVTGDDSGVLRVWSPEPARIGTELPVDPRGEISPVFSEDGSRLAIRTESGVVRLWDTGAVQPVGAPIRDVERPFFLLSSDGRFLLEKGGSLQLWDTQTGRPAGKHSSTSDGLVKMALNPEKKLIALQSGHSTIQIWNLATDRQIGTVRQDPEITSFAFTPGGDRLVTMSSDGAVLTWDSRSAQRLREILHQSAVLSFDVSSDGNLLATGTQRGFVRIWDLRSGKLLAGPFRHQYGVGYVGFQRVGDILLTGARNLLRLWGTRAGQPIGGSIRSEGNIWFAELSPDGARILVQSVDEPIRLLDAQTGQLLVSTHIQFSSSTKTRLSANGQLLWVASPSQVHVFVVPLFPKEDGELLARWAEAVAGWAALDEEGRAVELGDQLARREALRRETADAPPGQLRAASLIRWFLSDPKTRPVSPVFEGSLGASGAQD